MISVGPEKPKRKRRQKKKKKKARLGQRDRVLTTAGVDAIGLRMVNVTRRCSEFTAL